ncbi:MAG: membrane protein insertase YidC [Burkholderiaceae bacterium]|nr:membrane protein insertase YidC [Burkholderiaceae bacterium]
MTFRNRTTLWLVLVISCVMLWDNWQVYNGGSSFFFQSSGKSQASAKKTRAKASEQKEVEQAVEEKTAAPAPTEVVQIATDVVIADIDTAGGVIKRLELLKHKDKVDPSKNMVLFDTESPRTYLAQTGLTGGKFPSHKTAFVAKPGARSLGDADQVQLVLEAEQGGVKLVKTFTFKRGDYTIGVKHDVTNLNKTPIEPSLYLQLVRDGDKPEGESKLASTFTGPAVYTDADKFQKLDFEKIEKGKEEHANKADNGWVAMVQHYFVSAFIPPDKVEREIYSSKVDTNLYAVGDILPLGAVAPGATASMDARLYAGPQDAVMLEKTAPGLELVRDYGWVTIIAKPIFWLLLQIQKVVGNWGWSIIWLTVLIKVLFVPLSAASYRSMANMKECQPKIEDIRERYKDDKPAMNKAMMDLYKTEKINPLGGCLPVVIQIPVFIALYWVLLASVEIRNAPWLGWITDLAMPDPWYILPVLMAVSMFVQQKMTPPPPDPTQAKVMMFMPLVFSVMFFFFPAGLVLYWIVNNLLSIAQQAWVNKRYEADKAKKKKPA